MYNVLLDPLPEEWNGHRIDPAFQNGIQIMELVENTEISEREKVWLAADLLFVDPPESIQEILDGIRWFMSGWNRDGTDEEKNETGPVMDWEMDQWRIYSAFKKQYGIDLNSAHMHFWVFMGLLTTLDECAFTRVADIRAKKLEEKMDPEEKEFYRRAKKRYAIGTAEEAETDEDIQAMEEFRRLAGLG